MPGEYVPRGFVRDSRLTGIFRDPFRTSASLGAPCASTSIDLVIILSQPHNSPLFPVKPPSHHRKHAQEVSEAVLLFEHSSSELVESLLTGLNSGVARSLGKSAFARPSFTRRAVEPLRRHGVPAIAQRWASTETAGNGKIHQVIGAVVDGMKKSF
jgi:hypothetical protein